MSVALGVLLVTSARAADLEQISAAAEDFAVQVESAGATLSQESRTVEVVPFGPVAPSPRIEEASAALRQALVASLLRQGTITILNDTGGHAKPSLSAFAGVLDLDDGALAVLKVVNARSDQVLLSRQRPLAVERHAAPASQRALNTTRPEAHRARIFAFAGPGIVGPDTGVNIGLAAQPVASRWEASVGMLVYHHRDQTFYEAIQNAQSILASSKFSVTSFELKGAYVYPIEYVRSPWGDPLARFPGAVKFGGGLAITYARETYFTDYSLWPTPVRQPAFGPQQWSHWRLQPLIGVAVSRELGPRLDLQVGGDYVYAPERFGLADYTLDGLRLLLQLNVRIL